MNVLFWNDRFIHCAIATAINTATFLSAEQHCHTGDLNAGNIDKRARRKLIIASVLCLFFMVVEIVGGVLANSLAIATDAAHLLTDFASFMISLFSLWVASRPATRYLPICSRCYKSFRAVCYVISRCQWRAAYNVAHSMASTARWL